MLSLVILRQRKIHNININITTIRQSANADAVHQKYSIEPGRHCPTLRAWPHSKTLSAAPPRKIGTAFFSDRESIPWGLIKPSVIEDHFYNERGYLWPHGTCVDSMEAEKKAEYFSQNTIALRKLPLLLHPFIFHPINSTVEKWAEFTQRETEMSVTDEKVFFFSSLTLEPLA